MSHSAAPDTTSKRPFFVVLLGLIIAAMFLVEHDMNASLVFQAMTNATSLEQLDSEGIMFEQSSGRQLGGVMLGALGAFFIIQRGRNGRSTSGALAGWLLLYFAWALLSVSWADDPSLTARRLVLFGCMGVGAWAIATRFSPRDIATLAVVGPLLFLAAGLYAEYSNGTLAFGTPGYRFAGTVHPNAQAINCAILFFASFYFVRTTPRRRMFFVALLLFAVVMLYLTKSRTALASTFVALFAFEAMLLSGSRRAVVLLGGITAVIAVFLLSEALLPVVQDRLTLGRTDVGETFGTLTGRWPLWTQLSGFVAERPALGYGYGGFWNYDNSMLVIEEQGWPISHAHNAYLDTMLELGPVGCIALIVVLLLGLRLAFAARVRTGDRGFEFLGLILAFAILNGLLESLIIQRTFLTLLVMMILAHVARYATAPAPRTVPVPQPDALRAHGAGALNVSREGGR